MTDLYAFHVTVTGELTQVEAERLDDLLVGFADLICEAVLDALPADFLPAGQADFDVKVVAA